MRPEALRLRIGARGLLIHILCCSRPENVVSGWDMSLESVHTSEVACFNASSSALRACCEASDAESGWATP